MSGITSSRNFVINMDGRGSGEIQTNKYKLEYESESESSGSGSSGSGSGSRASWYEMNGSEETESGYYVDTKKYEDTLTQKVKYNLSCTYIACPFLDI